MVGEGLSWSRRREAEAKLKCEAACDLTAIASMPHIARGRQGILIFNVFRSTGNHEINGLRKAHWFPLKGTQWGGNLVDYMLGVGV